MFLIILVSLYHFILSFIFICILAPRCRYTCKISQSQIIFTAMKLSPALCVKWNKCNIYVAMYCTTNDNRFWGLTRTSGFLRWNEIKSSLQDNVFYYTHFEITDGPCNLIGSNWCDLFTNCTIFCFKSHLFPSQ